MLKLSSFTNMYNNILASSYKIITSSSAFLSSSWKEEDYSKCLLLVLKAFDTPIYSEPPHILLLPGVEHKCIEANYVQGYLLVMDSDSMGGYLNSYMSWQQFLYDPGKGDKVYWNEKFSFEFSVPEWEKSKHLKLKLMGKEVFSSHGFVAGETTVHLGGIITEGMDRGSIELLPTFHNVVLEDDTYKGQMKIGFKFTAKDVTPPPTAEEQETRLSTTEEKKEPEKSLCKTLKGIWRVSLCKLLLYYTKRSSKSEGKHI